MGLLISLVFKIKLFLELEKKNLFLNEKMENQKNKFKVFITLPLDYKQINEIFENSNIDLTINTDIPLSRETYLKNVRGCHGIIAFTLNQIDKEVLDCAGPQLKALFK